MCRSNHKSEIINHKSTAFSLVALVALWAATAAIAAENFGTGVHPVRAINDSCIMAGTCWPASAGNLFLKYYNGAVWTDHYSDLKNFAGCTVFWKDKKPGPDGYWLLPGVGVSGNQHLYALNKWDGTTFTDLKGNLIGFSGSICTIARWGSCGYWLIGSGGAYQQTPHLNKYDDVTETWTDLSSGIAKKGYGVTKMLYNGSYWLITGNGGWAMKYDGANFTDVSSGWGEGWGNDIDGLGWNGSYWLVGGCRGWIKKFDGSAWTDLTSAAGFEGCDPFGIAWSPTLNYWLVGTENLGITNGGYLKRFDGSTWTSVDGWKSNWNVWNIDWTGTTFVIGYCDVSDGQKCKIASYDGTTITQGVKVIPEPGGITLVVCAAVAGLIRLLWNRKKG
ncbi:MAG: hypothetical protein KKA28_15470 [Planctomycetes bacterium]|nr:hypothetical protein [Planctomycetota bacterium]